MKKLMVFGLSLFIIILFISLVAAVRVNEVSPETPEFVEIYNENNEVINLSEWKIRDNYNIDEITCYNITNCLLIINFSYFIIIGRNTNLSDITNNSINYFYVDDATIGNGLASNDNITLFNLTFSTSFSWNSSEAGKSWQFYNETWQNCTPTPGRENFCQQQNITQNTTTNSSQNKNSSSNQTQENKISLGLDWDEDDIINGEDFKIEVSAFNLKNEKYDIKVYISSEDDNKIISEVYDTENEKWISGNYYVDEVFQGSGDVSEDFKLRIKSSYKDFKGDAEIIAKIRKTGSSSIIDEIKEDVEVLENEDTYKNNTITQKTNETSKTTEKNDKKTAQITGEIIKLGNKKETSINTESKILYESKSEKIKKYSIYGLNLILIVILIFLLKNRGRKS